MNYPLTVYLTDPTLQEIRNAVETLHKTIGENYWTNKILVKFAEEIEVRINRYNVKKIKEMKVRFFESQQGTLCYTFHKRTGYPISLLAYKKIESLTIIPPAVKKEDRKAKVLKLIQKIHPNAWDDIKKEASKNPEKYTHYDLRPVYISSKFPDYVIKQLEHAFTNKLDYHYKQNGSKRDLNVETKLCKDGIFRAWFSSEYAGCLNGSYYLLLNPKLASFREDD